VKSGDWELYFDRCWRERSAWWYCWSAYLSWAVAAVLKSGEGVAGFRERARESAPIELQRRWVEGNGVGRLQHDLCPD
jgi:hypothetical protein